MSLTTRSGKGAPLTNAEVDANFTYLEDLANSKMDNTGTPDIRTLFIALARVRRCVFG